MPTSAIRQQSQHDTARRGGLSAGCPKRQPGDSGWPPSLRWDSSACANQQASGGRPNYASKQPDATIEMHQVQAAFLASGNGGTGTLYYRGRTYPFHVGGRGIGGIGASTIESEGKVLQPA
jgi:hypothetical protein